MDAEEDPVQTFGGRIAEIRKKRDLTLRQAADRAGRITPTDRDGESKRDKDGNKVEELVVSQTGWLRIERDERRNPKLETLQGMAIALNIEIVIDPEGISITELDTTTGVICASCGRRQEFGEENWAQEHGLWYCPDHRSDVVG